MPENVEEPENESGPSPEDFLVAVGMFKLASISYFFMALEAFINLLFHVLMKCQAPIL